MVISGPFICTRIVKNGTPARWRPMLTEQINLCIFRPCFSAEGKEIVDCWHILQEILAQAASAALSGRCGSALWPQSSDFWPSEKGASRRLQPTRVLKIYYDQSLAARRAWPSRVMCQRPIYPVVFLDVPKYYRISGKFIEGSRGDHAKLPHMRICTLRLSRLGARSAEESRLRPAMAIL